MASYDLIILVVGIFIGRIFFENSSRIGRLSFFSGMFPTYDVLWTQINRVFHVTKIVIVDPAEIIIFALGTGMICGLFASIVIKTTPRMIRMAVDYKNKNYTSRDGGLKIKRRLSKMVVAVLGFLLISVGATQTTMQLIINQTQEQSVPLLSGNSSVPITGILVPSPQGGG